MKKRSLRRILCAALVVLLLIGCCCIFSSAEGAFRMRGSSLMENDYLSLYVNERGVYALGTTGGDPATDADDNQKLLFGWDESSTSYTTFVVDDSVETFGDINAEQPRFVEAPAFDLEKGINTAVWESPDGFIRVRQILSIVNNNSTMRDDVLQIRYEVTNTSVLPHKVGSRIMLDTMLGNNDDAPFRVPGTGEITTQTEFRGSDIPQYWQAFDSLTSPCVVAQGSFLRMAENRPDAVQFTNWPKVVHTAWNCPVTAGETNGDSAVTVIWEPAELAAGETRYYETWYGLSAFVRNVEDNLSVSLYGDSNIPFENGRYNPNPMTVTAYLTNTGDTPLRDIKVKLAVPKDGVLNIGDTTYATYTYELLEPGQVVQPMWSIRINGTSEEIIETLVLTVETDGLKTRTLTKDVTIAAGCTDCCTECPECSCECTPSQPVCPPCQPQPTAFQKLCQAIGDFFYRLFHMVHIKAFLKIAFGIEISIDF